MEKNMVTSFLDNIFQDKDLFGNSSKWANWMSRLTMFTCKLCWDNHGKIVDISLLNGTNEVNAHHRCKCVYVPMRTKIAGTATEMGVEGADAYLIYTGHLPDYYVNKSTAYALGWKKKHKQLDSVLPGKMIGGDLYTNDDNKLPSAPGRIWYEADMNYDGGKRNRQRILYSNDGLVFVSYDHYQTFYEIVR